MTAAELAPAWIKRGLALLSPAGRPPIGWKHLAHQVLWGRFCTVFILALLNPGASVMQRDPIPCKPLPSPQDVRADPAEPPLGRWAPLPPGGCCCSLGCWLLNLLGKEMELNAAGSVGRAVTQGTQSLGFMFRSFNKMQNTLPETKQDKIFKFYPFL